MAQLGKCAVTKGSIAPPTRPLFACSGRGTTLSPFGARSYCRKCTVILAKGSIAPTQPLFVGSGRGITSMSPFGARSNCRREMFFPEKRLAKVSCASSSGVAFPIRSIISKSIDVLLAIWALAGFTYHLSKAVASVEVGGVASLPVTYSNDSSMQSGGKSIHHNAIVKAAGGRIHDTEGHTREAGFSTEENRRVGDGDCIS